MEVRHSRGTALAIIQALECLQESATTLRTLQVSHTSQELDSALHARLTQAINPFHHLTNLTLNMPYESTALLHLASLFHLSSFSTSINVSNCQALIPSGSTPSFLSLRHLEVWGSNIEDDTYNIAQFIGSIHPHSLKSLNIHAFTPPRIALAGDLLVAIATHHTIESLHVLLQGGPALQHSAPPGFLKPLERLSSLATIDLHGIPIAFTGPSLGQLAYAWPDLKTFFLGSCWAAPSQVRFCDLIPFAKRCRNLQSFAFVAAPHMPPYDDFSREEHLQEALSLPDTFSSPLELLFIGSEATSVELAPQIGAFLANYFPAVRSVLGTSADGRTRLTLNPIIIAKEAVLG